MIMNDVNLYDDHFDQKFRSNKQLNVETFKLCVELVLSLENDVQQIIFHIIH